MDVHTPRSLDEALALKAELPEARFVQGGTDVLVELNFDRSRPPALINLNEVPELRGFATEGDTLVLGVRGCNFWGLQGCNTSPTRCVPAPSPWSCCGAHPPMAR